MDCQLDTVMYFFLKASDIALWIEDGYYQRDEREFWISCLKITDPVLMCASKCTRADSSFKQFVQKQVHSRQRIILPVWQL